jgi:aminopeptidase N
MVVDLDLRRTRVETTHTVESRHTGHAPLVLDCEAIEVASIDVDGMPLDQDGYGVVDNRLTIHDVPPKCRIKIVNYLDPSSNTRLSGLYHSGNMLCTQCEAEGFRRITPALDRPDNLAVFRVILRGPASKFPVLLCNGNLVRDETSNGIHETEWHDPWPKPTYLFAIVAGALSCMRDRFVTRSGREVQLDFYAADRDLEKCEYAMQALQRAMRWDEEAYGREYDLDLYNVVAVGDFNMGAMENKSLNIFNTKYVLADPSIATDADFHNVESVIAHEYFHNWSGNRVTCRDWFQLSLKEGFTVFRDQCFSADMASPGVQRINDVNVLRNHQFPEDGGPLAHPVRPDSYQEINNFYTATVYNKGAEVVRMLRTLVGGDTFRQGTDLYFQRHDGEAVTTEDFVAAIMDATGQQVDFDDSGFQRWYAQAGTPVINVEGQYDSADKRYTLTLRQHCPATPGQDRKAPFVIPVSAALFSPEGEKLALDDGRDETVLILSDEEQQYHFDGLAGPPVPSLLRDFSAPVKLEDGLDSSALGILFRHDDDPFNRWEAGQRLFQQVILDNLSRLQCDKAPRYPGELLDLTGQLIESPGDDLLLAARLLSLPGEAWLSELSKPVDPQRLARARLGFRQRIASLHGDALAKRYHHLQAANDGSMSPGQSGIRALRDCCLSYLSSLDTRDGHVLARKQLATAKNMTDRHSALVAIADSTATDRADLLEGFFDEWREEALVVDRWFRVQAMARHPGVFDEVRGLVDHPAFETTNPNKVFALLGGFSRGNPAGFHREDGAGYRFLADWVCRLDPVNPQVASRLVSALTPWRDMIPALAEGMHSALERIRGQDGLSADVSEMVSRSLAEDQAAHQ